MSRLFLVTSSSRLWPMKRVFCLDLYWAQAVFYHTLYRCHKIKTSSTLNNFLDTQIVNGSVQILIKGCPQKRSFNKVFRVQCLCVCCMAGTRNYNFTCVSLSIPVNMSCCVRTEPQPSCISPILAWFFGMFTVMPQVKRWGPMCFLQCVWHLSSVLSACVNTDVIITHLRVVP